MSTNTVLYIICIHIAEILKDGEIFKMMCTANKGKKECGKRQLRGQTRNVLAEHLEKESTIGGKII